MVIDLTIQTYVLLFITGLCSGFVDSIAGGGGLNIPSAVPAGATKQFSGTIRAMSKSTQQNFSQSNNEPAYIALGTLGRTYGILNYLADGAALVSTRYAQSPLPFSY